VDYTKNEKKKIRPRGIRNTGKGRTGKYANHEKSVESKKEEKNVGGSTKKVGGKEGEKESLFIRISSHQGGNRKKQKG